MLATYRRRSPSQLRPPCCYTTTSAHVTGRKQPESNQHQENSGHAYSLEDEARCSNSSTRHQQAQLPRYAPAPSRCRKATASHNADGPPARRSHAPAQSAIGQTYSKNRKETTQVAHDPAPPPPKDVTKKNLRPKFKGYYTKP